MLKRKELSRDGRGQKCWDVIRRLKFSVGRNCLRRWHSNKEGRDSWCGPGNSPSGPSPFPLRSPVCWESDLFPTPKESSGSPVLCCFPADLPINWDARHYGLNPAFLPSFFCLLFVFTYSHNTCSLEVFQRFCFSLANRTQSSSRAQIKPHWCRTCSKQVWSPRPITCASKVPSSLPWYLAMCRVIAGFLITGLWTWVVISFSLISINVHWINTLIFKWRVNKLSCLVLIMQAIK